MLGMDAGWKRFGRSTRLAALAGERLMTSDSFACLRSGLLHRVTTPLAILFSGRPWPMLSSIA
jgi:hypothetical protein